MKRGRPPSAGFIVQIFEPAWGFVYDTFAGGDPAEAARLMKRGTKMCRKGLPAFQRPFLDFLLHLLLLLLLIVETGGLMETNPNAPFLHLISSKVQAEEMNMERPSAQGKSDVEVQGCGGSLRPAPTARAASSDPACGMNRAPETPSSMLARLREGQVASSSSSIVQGPGSGGGSNHGVTGASSPSQQQLQQNQKSPRRPSKRGRPPGSSGGTPKKTTPRKLTQATQAYSLPISPLSKPSGPLDPASESKLLAMELVREAQAAAELDLENAALRDTVDRLRGAEHRREMTSRHSAQVLEMLVSSLASLEASKCHEEEASLKMSEARLGRYELTKSWNVTTRQYKYDEVWHDGVTLAAAKDEVARLRKELEAANRQITSTSQNLRREKKRKGSAGYHQLVECEETLKIRARDLAERLKGAQDSLARMNREKKTVTRRATRLKMQADSLFFREAGGMVLNRRYAILSLIGSGGFAQVYRAFDLVTLREVACKVMQVDHSWEADRRETYLRCARREHNIQSQMAHPRVVRLIDTFEVFKSTGPSLCTVLEMCEGGDLETILNERKRIEEARARSIARQVLSGLCYLHSQRSRVIHYDLKPGNILLSREGEVRISDFGLSRLVGEGMQKNDAVMLSTHGGGTYWYLPPECFPRAYYEKVQALKGSRAVVTPKVDIWSLGVVVYEMVVGKKPFAQKKTAEEIYTHPTEMLNAWRKPVEWPKSLHPAPSEQCLDFIRSCLVFEPSLRPSSSDLLNHTWLKH